MAIAATKKIPARICVLFFNSFLAPTGGGSQFTVQCAIQCLIGISALSTSNPVNPVSTQLNLRPITIPLD